MTSSPTSPARSAAVQVLKNLRDAGHEAYFAGGSVRDDIMGVRPKDFDVTTSATPSEVTALFDRCIEVGAQFGVIVVLTGDHEIEVATFRTESGYADGRRPDTVTWTTAREDVLRRDFTINGLLGDPLALEPAQQVIDHVGGVNDIARRVIRAIGDPETRFREDQLRLLRAIRFAARLDFTIEDETWHAVQTLAPAIETVSAERTRDELQRLLTEGGAQRGWRLLMQSGLLSHVLPEAPDPDRVLERLVDAPMTAEEGWAIVLLDTEDNAEAISMWSRRMKTSKALMRHVTAATSIAASLTDYESLPIAHRKRLVRRHGFHTACRAARAAVTAGQRPTAPLQEAQADGARWSDADLRPTPLIDGGTLRQLGHAPGPAFKAALDAVEDAQLAHEITEVSDAIALAVRVLDAQT